MKFTKDEQAALIAGLKIRDQLGGHHFLQCEIGGGVTHESGRVDPRYACRDCGITVLIDPEVWKSWWSLYIAVPDHVREVLGRKDCS